MPIICINMKDNMKHSYYCPSCDTLIVSNKEHDGGECIACQLGVER